MSDPPRHSVSVAAAIVSDDGQVLAIQRRDNGHWEPPGGVVEHGEAIRDALVREVHEETGLFVEPEQLTGIYQNLRIDVVAFVFRCHVVGGRAHTTDEASKVSWLSFHEVSSLMDEAYAIRLLDAVSNDSRPRIRIHNGTTLLSAAEQIDHYS